MSPQGPELPNLGGNNPRNSSNYEPETPNKIVWADSTQNQQIIWEESDDVYKPIAKKIQDFQVERDIQGRDLKQVYIKEDALEKLKKHLASNLRVEQGGILFGNAYQDPVYGIYVEITAAVPAPATIGTGAHLEFTSDSWLGIMDYARHEHPQENIVGWYHSHPNIGVFMSGTDMNTQRAFFSHPWCLSIVHDPVRLTIGYFLGESARSVQPVIFGGVNSGYSKEPVIEPGGNQENVQQIENTSTETEGSLAPISRQHNRSRRSSKFLYFPLFLLFLALVVVLFIIVLKGQQFSNTGISQPTTNASPTATQPALPFKASLESRSATVFNFLKNEKILLRYLFVQAGDKIGGGDEVTWLLISKEGKDVTENIKLEVKQLKLKEDVEIDNNKVIDFIKDKTASIENNSSEGDLKSLSLPLKIGELGVMIPLFSSNISKSGNSGSPDTAPQSKTIKKGEVIYVPIKLTYQDASQQKQEVELKNILK